MTIAFALEPFHRNVSEELLFKNLAEMWTILGRQPKFRDCYPGLSRYSAHTYAHRFGSWRGALERFVEWTKSTTTNPRKNSMMNDEAERTIERLRQERDILRQQVNGLVEICDRLSSDMPQSVPQVIRGREVMQRLRDGMVDAAKKLP